LNLQRWDFSMLGEVLLIVAGVGTLSTALTWVVLRVASRHGLLDLPNERSSHVRPTPRGGGLGIVVASAVGWGVLGALRMTDMHLIVALLGGGFAVASVGFLDDRHQLSAAVRLLVHVAAALSALLVLGGLPAIQVGGHIVRLGLSGYVLGILGIVWVLNLFNFMDGIDGIAASEAIFVAISGALLLLLGSHATQVPVVGLIFGAAALGFLPWNWPPAKIFMGDIGSGFLGYVLSVLALAATRDCPAAIWIWLVLGGVFAVDATVTLVRRAIRGERLYEAHRTHAYQRLARRWGSHQRVTLIVTLVNFGWLLPCALIAAFYPSGAIWIAAVALAPLCLTAVAAGSGRSEHEA
jgi:Fuc2NAc and GlcNAc transferase